MSKIDDLARKANPQFDDLKPAAQDAILAKVQQKVQADELLALICEKSGQDPAEVIAVTDACRELGYLRDLPALTVEG